MSDGMVRPAAPGDSGAIRRLCWAYRAMLQERVTDSTDLINRFYPEETYDALIDSLPEVHARPMGDILVAELVGQTVGCAMYYPFEPPLQAEVKRVYLEPAARGSGLGRALMDAVIARARADGYRSLVLDTVADLTEAIALYERLGFEAVAPYYDVTPYLDTAPDLLTRMRFFERRL